MVFGILFLLPAIIAFAVFAFGHREITIKEFGVQVVAQAIVAALSVAVVYSSNTSDSEVWNGQVTSKESRRVSCGHDYRCHCRQVCTGSGKKRSCSTRCQTCYRHSYDMNWEVRSTIGDFRISRLDSQGLNEPPRWTSVKVGDPVAETHSYENFIKAAPGTLFRHQGLLAKYEGKIPEYPLNVFDYYNLNRVVLVNGANLPDLLAWNAGLARLNGELGKAKQVNVVLVVVKDLGGEFSQALGQAWLGGKKNDVIVVIGTPDNQTVTWSYVMSWTDRQILKVKLRDAVLDVGKLDKDAILASTKYLIEQHYVRKEMKDFVYLKGSITPTVTQFVVSLIFGVLVAAGLSYFFYHNDLFETRKRRW